MNRPANDNQQLVHAMEPLAQALGAHIESDTPVSLAFRRADGLWYEQSTEDYFTAPHWLADIEFVALDLTQSPALDVGAGSGRHSLALQNLGIDVTALDVHPKISELVKAQGVEKVVTANINTFSEGGWATVLFLMETIGLVGTLDGLTQLLTHLKTIVREDGQILIDSEPVVIDPDAVPEDDAINLDSYEGEQRLQMRFLDIEGATFGWLYIDPDTLVEISARCGWHAHIAVIEPETEHYLARLTHAG